MHDYSDIPWWENKIGRLSQKAFHPDVGKWDVEILRKLTNDTDGIIKGEKPRDLARQLGVPKKYVMRSLALMARPGLVTLAYNNGWQVTQTRSGNRKLVSFKRQAPTVKERAALLAAEKYLCGHCCKKFPANLLCIDHLVPLAMMGADEAGNWGALCSQCNRKKWHDFDKEWLKLYRGKPVEQKVGVVVAGNRLWPRIDGSVRRQSRARLVAKANS